MIDYLEEVKKIIAKQFELEEETIDEESYLESDLNITELDLEDLIAQLEDKYELEIPQDVYSKFKTVSDIANYLYENAASA